MFKIGEFSRLSRVSVRMLRHYDQLRLLKPSQIDPLTNYRYYLADQLPRLNRILALQDLGFSLHQIGELLNENLPIEELRGMLKLKRAEIEQGVEAEQARLRRLEARIRQMAGEAESASYDVVLRGVEPELVATKREVAASEQRIQAMFEEVEIYVAQYGQARGDRPTLAVYHDAEYREKDIDAEVAVPVTHSIPGSDVIDVCELPGVERAACVLHSGGYSTLYQAYNALLGWIEASSYHMAGPIREVYLRYGTDGLGLDLPTAYLAEGPEHYVTELQVPVEAGPEH